MAMPIPKILDTLRTCNIIPEEGLEQIDLPRIFGEDLPAIGRIEEGEAVYTTSLDAVLCDDDEFDISIFNPDNPRVYKWWREIQSIMENELPKDSLSRLGLHGGEPPEPHCAWYCPIHFFGHGWGIYIRESCILSHAIEIAHFVDWRRVSAPDPSSALQLLRSAFYVFFLHEQFHHKVESLGFRLLVATGSDHYRPYKSRVYRNVYLTPDCLEESLANAESYRRLGEIRYTQRVDQPIRDGLREYLKASFRMQPPGYAEGGHLLNEPSYRYGLYTLQSQILDGRLMPTTPAEHWSVAPNMITALADISDDIYIVVPTGARPIFNSTWIDPRAITSSGKLINAVIKYHGYELVRGGKGSHVKLCKPGAGTMTIPGNRPVVSPGVVKHVLDVLGGYPLSKLPDLLCGRLPAHG